MGGGDLNMKKSWHPLLMKNQERVWLKEKEALEEKKKLDQLRKELEEERQLQELQRLQEEQTGRKRQDKLEWMYATPAAGNGPSASDLEDYLLGKKRVDKILTGDENEKVGAAHKNFIAVQNANNARDMAAKVREDPMFLIKQQEQAALKDLMSNPLRLKALKEKAGFKESKKEKKEKHRHSKHKHRHREIDDREAEEDVRGREDYERRREEEYDRYNPRRQRRSDSSSRTRSQSPSRRRPDRRSRSPTPHRQDRYPSSPPRREPYNNRRSPPRDLRRDRSRERSASRERIQYDRPSPHRQRSPPPRERRPSPPRRSRDNSYPTPRSSTNDRPSDAAVERAARLAAMTQDASSLEASRQARLQALEIAEKAERELQDAIRMKVGRDGKSNFVREQEKVLYGGNMKLDERIQRGRMGLVRDHD